MRKFFAIGGHCTSEKRIKLTLELLICLRKKWPDGFIAYSSHIPVDKRIQEFCDLVLIDKNNLLGNVDYYNSHTKNYKHYFWQIPRPGFNISKTIPYHQYANHRQYHDLSVALTELYNAEVITFFTYDCEPEAVNEIDLHYELIERYDAVFYDFFIPGDSVNTEFFTLRSNAINGLRKIFKQDDFFSFSKTDEFTLEQIYFALMKKEKIQFKILDKRESNDGRFGVMAQHDRQENIRLSLLNPQHPDVQICPFLDWTIGKTKMVVFMQHHHFPQEPYNIKIQFSNENDEICDYDFNQVLSHNNWVLIDVAEGFPIVDVFKKEEHLFKFDLGESLNYGIMERA